MGQQGNKEKKKKVTEPKARRKWLIVDLDPVRLDPKCYTISSKSNAILTEYLAMIQVKPI
jgi:hypothetical protein